MRKRWKILTVVSAVCLLPLAYPVCILGYVWIKVEQSDLPGGHNGPLDAYRHTLASALVAYTLDAKVVEWVSDIMEHRQIATHQMDRQNNRIGAMIGSRAKSLSEIEPAVAKQVAAGTIFARDPDQSTWLPEFIWNDQKMW